VRTSRAVVGEAADGAQAVALARAARPEVVERVRVLILTTYHSDAHVFQALPGWSTPTHA
jgi:DNA-binding NarL/FixJ family response regulator